MPNVWQAFRGLKKFAADSLVFSASVYAECLGWEISTFLVTQTKDLNQMGAYALLVNFTGIIWQIGNGFTSTSRARLNYLLGNLQKEKAKELFEVIAIGIVLMSLVFSMLVSCFRHEIAMLYANNSTQMSEVLSNLLQIYSFCLIGDFYYSFIFSIARTIEKVWLNLLLNVIFLIFCHFGISLYLIKKQGGTCYSCLLVMQCSLLLIHAAMTFVTLRTNWSDLSVLSESAILIQEGIPLNEPTQTDLLSNFKTI